MIDHAKLWSEKKYIDTWSIPHLLAGVVLVGIFSWLGFSFWPNLILSFLLIIGWEFFELYILGIHEHYSNKVMDVILGIIGFFIMYAFILKYNIYHMINELLFITIVFLFLNAWGFLAYKKRTGRIS